MRFEERLLRSIVRVHSRFLADEDPHPLFEELLEDLLDFTESDYGFLGETMVSPSGALSLKVHAFGSRPPGRAALESFRSSAPDGLELGSPHTLIGAVLRTAKPVLANEPSSDPRRGGLPPGHPPLQSFLGIPLHHGHRFVGMMGAANRAGGYTQELLARLEPFIVTSASVVDARRSIRERRRAEEAQARLVAILEATTDVIGPADAQGRLTYLNRAARRLRGIGEDGDLSGGSVLAGHTPWARRRILEEALVLESIRMAPGRIVSSTPPFPQTTSSTAALSLTMVTITSASRAASAGLDATRAPARSSGSALLRVRL